MKPKTFLYDTDVKCQDKDIYNSFLYAYHFLDFITALIFLKCGFSFFGTSKYVIYDCFKHNISSKFTSNDLGVITLLSSLLLLFFLSAMGNLIGKHISYNLITHRSSFAQYQHRRYCYLCSSKFFMQQKQNSKKQNKLLNDVTKANFFDKHIIQISLISTAIFVIFYLVQRCIVHYKAINYFINWLFCIFFLVFSDICRHVSNDILQHIVLDNFQDNIRIAASESRHNQLMHVFATFAISSMFFGESMSDLVINVIVFLMAIFISISLYSKQEILCYRPSFVFDMHNQCKRYFFKDNNSLIKKMVKNKAVSSFLFSTIGMSFFIFSWLLRYRRFSYIHSVFITFLDQHDNTGFYFVYTILVWLCDENIFIAKWLLKQKILQNRTIISIWYMISTLCVIYVGKDHFNNITSYRGSSSDQGLWSLLTIICSVNYILDFSMRCHEQEIIKKSINLSKTEQFLHHTCRSLINSIFKVLNLFLLILLNTFLQINISYLIIGCSLLNIGYQYFLNDIIVDIMIKR